MLKQPSYNRKTLEAKVTTVFCFTSKKTGKQYVGMTSKPPLVRLHELKTLANNQKKNNPHLYNALVTHNVDDWDIKILDVFTGPRGGRRNKWIEQLNTVHPHGYNNFNGRGARIKNLKAQASKTNVKG